MILQTSLNLKDSLKTHLNHANESEPHRRRNAGCQGLTKKTQRCEINISTDDNHNNNNTALI